MKLLLFACLAVIGLMASGTSAKPDKHGPRRDLNRSEIDPLCFCNISGEGIVGGKPQSKEELECNAETVSECKSICEERLAERDEKEKEDEAENDDGDEEDREDEDQIPPQGGDRRGHRRGGRRHGRERPRDHRRRICCKNNITGSVQVSYFAWVRSSSPECGGSSPSIREETINCTDVECPPENQRPQNRPQRRRFED